MRFVSVLISGFLSLALMVGGVPSLAGPDHMPPRVDDASAWHPSEFSRVRLIRAGRDADGNDLLGLVFEMDEGWHTYWRSAGSLGLPPTFNWDGSSNFVSAELHWPLPEYIAFEGYETYGYEGRLVLPISVRRENPFHRAHIQLAIGYAVCEDVCIPTLGFLELDLPPGPAAMWAPEEFQREVLASLEHVPTTDLNAAGISMTPAQLQWSEEGWALHIHASSLTPFENPQVIVEGPRGVRFARAEYEMDESGQILDVRLGLRRDDHADLMDGLDLRVTLSGGQMPVEAVLPVIMTPATGD